ncbi:STAS domain-containing protein [Mycobacterium sp. C31M]
MTDQRTLFTPPTCTVLERWLGDTVVMDCSGNLDLTTAVILERRIADALKANPTAIVINLSGLDFLAARGMSVLVGANTSLRGRIAFAVVADGPRTRRPMAMIGLDSQIAVHTTVDTALAAVGPSAPASAILIDEMPKPSAAVADSAVPLS